MIRLTPDAISTWQPTSVGSNFQVLRNLSNAQQKIMIRLTPDATTP